MSKPILVRSMAGVDLLVYANRMVKLQAKTEPISTSVLRDVAEELLRLASEIDNGRHVPALPPEVVTRKYKLYSIGTILKKSDGDSTQYILIAITVNVSSTGKYKYEGIIQGPDGKITLITEQDLKGKGEYLYYGYVQIRT